MESPTPEDMEKRNNKARYLVSSFTQMQPISQWYLWSVLLFQYSFFLREEGQS